MYNENNINEINRLRFENFLWIVFALLCVVNVYGDYNEIEYLGTNNKMFKSKSNEIFEITLIITLFIYIYFFLRNYKAYTRVTPEKRNLYEIKLLGSGLLIAGILCLLYFQEKQTLFTGSPAL